MLRWQLFRHAEPDEAKLTAYINAYAGPDCQSEWFEASQTVSNQLSLKAFDQLDLVNVNTDYKCRRYMVARVINGPQVLMPCAILQHWEFPEALVCTPIRRIEVTVDLVSDPNAPHINDTVATSHVQYRGIGFQLTHRFCGFQTSPRFLLDTVMHSLKASQLFTTPELKGVDIKFSQGGTLKKHPAKTLFEVMTAMNPQPPAQALENDGWHIPTSDDEDQGGH